MNRLPNNWQKIRKEVLKRDNFCCLVCGSKENLHVHHLYPKYFGGSHQLSNLTTLCDKCHATRHIEQQVRLARRSIEFLQYNLRKLMVLFKYGKMPVVNYAPLLRMLTGKSKFFPGQKEVIEKIFEGNDVLVIRPTGSGKSLIYQFPAVIAKKPSIVISPLKALMKDQVENLFARGIPVTFINSDISKEEKMNRLDFFQKGAFKLLYLAPERFDKNILANPQEIQKIKEVKIKYLIIDEAHNIEDWGHTFRQNYQRLNEIKRLFGNPQTIALTATATPYVRKEIVKSLAMSKPEVFVQGLDRPNIVLHVERIYGRKEFDLKYEFISYLLQYINAERKTIIYVPTIKIGNSLLERLRELKFDVEFFHSQLETLKKTNIQNRFTNLAKPHLDLLISTNAFGMGIDIPNIRFVIHWTLPKSLNSYYQEIGRAGRDKNPSLAILLKSERDENLIHFMIKKSIENANLSHNEKQNRLVVEKAELQKMVEYSKNDKCLRSFIHTYFQADFNRIQRSVFVRLLYFLFGAVKKDYKYCCTNCDSLMRKNKLLKVIKFVNRFE